MPDGQAITTTIRSPFPKTRAPSASGGPGEMVEGVQCTFDWGITDLQINNKRKDKTYHIYVTAQARDMGASLCAKVLAWSSLLPLVMHVASPMPAEVAKAPEPISLRQRVSARLGSKTSGWRIGSASVTGS